MTQAAVTALPKSSVWVVAVVVVAYSAAPLWVAVEAVAISVQEVVQEVPAVWVTVAAIPTRPIRKSSVPVVANKTVGVPVVPDAATGGVPRLGSKGAEVSAPVTVKTTITMLGVVPPETVSLTV